MKRRDGPVGHRNEVMDRNRLDIQLKNIRGAPRCGARTRRGSPCLCPAIKGRPRCRIHGGLSPGAPRGKQNGNYIDGYYTAEAVRERRWAKSLLDTFAKDRPNG
jgi:hypothetical protein